MKARAYQLCPLCARVTPIDAGQRCPHDGAVMLRHCPSCAAQITSPFATRCGTCGALYRPVQTEYSSQVKTPP